MQSNKFQYRESLTQTRLTSSKQLLLERRQLEFKVGEVSEVWLYKPTCSLHLFKIF